MMVQTHKTNSCSVLPSTLELEFSKEVWDLEKLAIPLPPHVPSKKFGFKRIEPTWLKELAKHFIRYHMATKAFETLRQYQASISRFSRFLRTLNRPIYPEDVNRSLILQFIAYLRTFKLVNFAKNKTLGHVEVLFTLAALEGWASVTKEKLIYLEDRFPVVYVKPRYIPDSVLEQLNHHLHNLPEDMRRLVLVLQHTGRRIGELCTLTIDCLLQDEEHDYFLRYYESKMRKEQTIPISLEIANCIKEQQRWVRNQLSNPYYLFSTATGGAITSETVRKALVNLAKRHTITAPDGTVWHFQPHQFRHTVGTKMINNGVPAHIVQRYLHHSSPKMTMIYAHIHDSTLKAEFTKFQGKLVGISGEIINKTPSELSSELR